MSESKRVLITGASAGFGYDTAKALAAKGHTVFAAMRGASGKNQEKAQTLTQWAQAGGHKVHILDLDVTDQNSVDKAVASAVAQGGIDVLINNAGIGTWGIDETYSVDQAKQNFDVNLFGVMRVNHAVVPHFRKAGKGLIVYVSSGLGRFILPFMAIYGASKFALECYAESTSYELAPLGIQTTIVQPGAYGTTFMQNSIQPQNPGVIGEYGTTATIFENFSKGFAERAQAGHLGNPTEVVNALVEEVERPAGERPLRRPVGRDSEGPAAAINQACEQVQDQLLRAFGLR